MFENVIEGASIFEESWCETLNSIHLMFGLGGSCDRCLRCPLHMYFHIDRPSETRQSPRLPNLAP